LLNSELITNLEKIEKEKEHGAPMHINYLHNQVAGTVFIQSNL